MRLDSTPSRDWEANFKTVLTTICLLFVFFVSTNDVCGEITIHAGSLLDFVLGSPNSEPLRPGKSEEFKATAYRTNPHDFQLAPGIEKDPEIDYIKFSATGGAKKPLFSNNLEGGSTSLLGGFTHSVEFKWDTLGVHTVRADVFDEDGEWHDFVEWRVQVGELTFEALPDLPSNPSIPDPPSVQVDPEANDDRSGYIARVASDMTFEVQATSDDGIATIEFLLEDSHGFRRLIDKKDNFLFRKRFLLYWPSLKVEHTWETVGDYRMIAKVTTEEGGLREVAWNIEVKGLNQPPTKLSGVPVVDLGSLTVGGEPGMVDVSEYFSDPEGNNLHFDEVGVHASTTNIITLKLLENRYGFKNIIEIEPKNPGRAVFYAIARERDGLTAPQSFTILVEIEQNRAPVSVDTIPDQTLTVDDSSAPLDLSTYFRDPNSKALSYTIELSNPDVALPQVIGSQLTIWTLSTGSTTVTVIATNTDGLFTTQTFNVTVTSSQNRPPLADDTIPDQTLTVGDSSAPLDLPTYFYDPDDDLLTYTVVSSDPNVAITQRVGSQLTIWTLNVGNTTVTVNATDPDGLFITQTFTVTVDPAPVLQRPEQVGTISTQYMTLSGGNITVDVAPYFSSPNTLSYTVAASPFGFVTASISGSHVTITPLQAGSASVFATARDSQNPDLSAIQTIPVSVSHAIIIRPPTPRPFTPPTTNPDVEGLREGVSVITQLTQGLPLNVRERPGIDEEILEQLGSGVIGTITDGPVRADGFRWWEIEWEIRGVDLEGWSAESDRGQTLFRRPPDLEIQDLDVSEDEVEPGDRFTVEVRVRNNGPGESVPTEVAVYYSLERHSNRAEFDADRNKYEVGTISIPSLRAGRRTERSLRVEAPGTPDRYYYGALLPSNIHPTDYTRDLPSDAHENDLASQERVTVTTAPDFIVASISSDTSVLDPGEAFSLEITVRNQGIGEPENNTTLRYYRSSNAAISSNDTEVGTASLYRGNLDTNGTERESISLTAPNEPGVYYYGACVDGVEHESNTRNNCSSAIAITVREPAPEPTPDFPDLVPSPPTVSANALAPGESFTLETTIENRGTGGSRDTTLRWHQSPDPNISSNDTEVGNARVSSLASGETATHQLDLNAPAAAGTYYYGVGVENVADESDTANNYSIGVAISVENRSPIPVGTLPPRTLLENDAPVAVDVAEYFTDPDNTALTYTAASDNPAVVMAEMRGSEMTITPIGAGNASVTVTASDGDLTATQTLSVSVVAAPTENEAPVAIGVIPIQSLMPDGASVTVDISAYFSDANDDSLTYAAWPDDKNVVKLLREGTLLTITPKAAGRATVTVRARDPDGLQAFQPISVFVSTTEVPVTELPAETWMPDANLRTAVRDALGLGPNDALTQQALQALTSLRYLGPDLSDNQKITDLTGLEHALNLEHLDLYMHLISDIRPLEKLTKLRSVWLAGNKIANIRPFTNLPLEELDLGGNPITDFAPLAELTSLTRLDFWGNGLGDNNLHLITGLTQLTQLDLRNNQISNVTPLTKLVNLKKLQLKGNPISDTSPLLTLTDQNPDLEIDIEIGEEPPSEPDTEIEVEVPDLIVESIRANKTAVDPGDVFRLDAVIKNQGKAASGAATVRFYRSPDETITTEDTQVRRSDLPSLAVDRTKNKWARLTAPNTAGVYYYGVCIDGVADESDTENNCSTAVKMTVGTVPVKPPVVETPATTDPETGEDPLQADLLAKQVFQKHGKILRRPDVKEVLPDVLTALKVPDTQALLNPATINLVIADPDLLKTMVPTISDKFITLMKTDAEIKTLLSDPQVQTLLQTPTAIDELAKLLGISIAPPPTVNEHWMPDANLRAAVRKALGLKPSETLTPQAMRGLTRLDVNLPEDAAVKDKIKDITGLEHATQLTWLSLYRNQVRDIRPVAGLIELRHLNLNNNDLVSDIRPVAKLTKLTTLCFNYNQVRDINPVKDLTNLWQLCLIGNQISDINPLKDLTNLTRLVVSQNKKISDIKILKGLTKLVDLALSENQISDITALENLTNLKALWLHRNRIRDITPLEGLTNLTLLFLDNNQISDVTPLENLTSLGVLYISGNPIGDVAPLRRLKAKNPNMEIDIDIGVGAAPSAPLVPDETALFSNYPNPFNPETWIPYQLAAAADVTVTIYDVRGVVVRRLALGHQTVGFYQSRARAAHWDGRNALGEKVASGLYFYTFTAGDFTAIGKMLIRK